MTDVMKETISLAPMHSARTPLPISTGLLLPRWLAAAQWPWTSILGSILRPSPSTAAKRRGRRECPCRFVGHHWTGTLGCATRLTTLLRPPVVAAEALAGHRTIPPWRMDMWRWCDQSFPVPGRKDSTNFLSSRPCLALRSPVQCLRFAASQRKIFTQRGA